MESDDEIDIESDFNVGTSLSVDVFGDTNEPPSKFAFLQPDMAQHPWALEQDWHLDNCTDEKSRAVIEKMMLEEQYYVNSGQLSNKEDYIPDKPLTPLALNVEDAKPTTLRRNWSAEEKGIFLKGLEIFGRKWSEIAQLLPNRTALQVKHFGYSYFKKKNQSDECGLGSAIDTSQYNVATTMQQMVAKVTTAQPTTTTAKSKNRRKASATVTTSTVSDVNKPVIEPESAADLHANNVHKFPDAEVIRLNRESSSDSEEIEVDVEDKTSDILDFSSVPPHTAAFKQKHTTDPDSINTHQPDPTTQTNTIVPEPDIKYNPTKEVVLDSQQCSPDPTKDVVTSENVEMRSEDVDCTPGVEAGGGRTDMDESQCAVKRLDGTFQIQGSDGKMYLLPSPTSVIELKPDEIHGQEMEIFCEFFDGRPGIKTAERYMKIRNHILDAWNACKPNYLYKTPLRNGLKKCGDVNIIGRIHSYLEQIGAINFGCGEAQYNRRARAPRKGIHKKNDDNCLPIKDNVNQRKRKVRDMFGIWVDERDMEGKTINHEQDVVSIVRKAPPKVKRRKPTPAYDPFQLVPCQEFTPTFPAPFDVDVDVSAMVLMDTHAHLCKTEVIGLLGGRYSVKNGLLQILSTEPCASVSTGMQCEMDPVSQTEAYERIRAAGMIVVGWYHSHPTFPPNPSIRDIETQHNFQEWFSVGKMPFVGIIVNPYSTDIAMVTSDIRCLVISKPEKTGPTQIGTPYQFMYKPISDLFSYETLRSKLCDLVAHYAQDSNRMDMLSRLNKCNTLTCIDKLVCALDVHLQILPSEPRKNIISALHNVVDNLYANNVIIATNPDNGDTDMTITL